MNDQEDKTIDNMGFNKGHAVMHKDTLNLPTIAV